MAKPSLSTISTTNTFQNWLDKTNELVALFQQDAITASVTGDTTSGDATLTGDFTATNLIATTKVTTNQIGHNTGGNTIVFDSPVSITGGSQVVATFTQAGGGQTRYTTGSLSWDVGIEDTNGNFIMNNGGGDDEFSLSPAGRLTVPGLTIGSLDLQAATATIDTLTVTTLTGLDTNSVAEAGDATAQSGTQYFTNARVAAALTDGTGIDISQDGNDVSTISANMTEIATGISLSNYADLTATGAQTFQGDITADNFTTTGDVRGTEFLVQGAYDSEAKYFTIYGSGSGTTPTLNFGLRQNSSTDRKMYLAANLNVECGTYAYDDITVHNGNDPVIRLDASAGAIIAEGDITAFGTVSDINLKDNIEIIPDALDKVSQLRGVTFNYKDDPDYKTTGLIAQEVEKVLPGVVYEVPHVEDDGETYKALRYGNVVGLLVEAIKELQDRIVELEKRCDCNG